MLGALALWGSMALAQDCPDPALALRKAENEIVGFYLSDAQTTLADAVEAFGCARPATAEDAARLLLARAMLAHLQDDPDAAAVAFASARRVDPGTFNEDYGAKAKKIWEEATPTEGADGAVALRNFGESERAWVDGTVQEKLPLRIAPGLHVLQAGAETPRFARFLEVSAGEELTVTLPASDVDTGGDRKGVEAGIAGRKKNFVPAVLVGTVAVGFYGGAAGARVAYDNNPSDAGFYAVDGLYGASVATGIAAGTMAIVQLVRK